MYLISRVWYIFVAGLCAGQNLGHQRMVYVFVFASSQRPQSVLTMGGSLLESLSSPAKVDSSHDWIILSSVELYFQPSPAYCDVMVFSFGICRVICSMPLGKIRIHSNCVAI